MDYLTVLETAEKWNVTARRVQILCANDRVNGAIKKAGVWFIPIEVEKPKRLPQKTKWFYSKSSHIGGMAMSTKNPLISPILKWVGGKRQLIDQIIPLINKRYSTYVEPFVGGGAVFFELQPSKAIINDYNEELINVYLMVRDYPDELIMELENHENQNCEDYFYKVRTLDRTEEYLQMSSVKKAARIIYLNKTCYNGLYRVNASGQFNSPYGKYKKPNIVNATMIRTMSKYLKKEGIVIKQGDYRDALKGLRKGAFVYLDPPYMPISSSSSFTGYTEKGFSFEQQVALKKECDKLKEKGISFLQSNSDCPEIRELYSEYEIRTVQAKRSINSNALKRGEVNEVLIYYVPEQR